MSSSTPRSGKPPLVEFQPDKLLKVVARTVRPGHIKPQPPRTPPSGTKDDDVTAEGLLGQLERLSQLAKQREAEAPCGLDLQRLSQCDSWTEEHCTLRPLECCPRKIQERQRADFLMLRGESVRRGVPERVLAAAFDREPRPTLALQKVQSWLHGNRSILVLSGTNQCGKTTAAGWAAACHRSLGGTRRKTHYYVASDIGNPHKADAMLAAASSVDLLVLDDLGQAYFGPTGFALNKLEVLVDAAYRNSSRLILCTDIALKDGERLPFFEAVGKRVAARILQSGRMEADLGGTFRI